MGADAEVGRRGGSRRGGGTEGGGLHRDRRGGTEITGAGGRIGSFSFFFLVLFLWFGCGGVGPQEAQKAQKLGSSGFCVFVAKVGWSRTLETNFNAKAQRRRGAERRWAEGRKGGVVTRRSRRWHRDRGGRAIQSAAERRTPRGGVMRGGAPLECGALHRFGSGD